MSLPLRHCGLRSVAEERSQTLTINDEPADRGCLRDDGGGPGTLAEDGKLANVVAGGVSGQHSLLAGVAADDADAALDEHDELVTEISLADDCLSARIDALDRGPPDPLQIFWRQLAEQRHT